MDKNCCITFAVEYTDDRINQFQDALKITGA